MRKSWRRETAFDAAAASTDAANSREQKFFEIFFLRKLGLGGVTDCANQFAISTAVDHSIVDLTDGATKVVSKKGQHIADFGWSADGERFATVVAPSNETDVVFEKSSLLLLSRNGEISKVLNENVSDRRGVAWSPDGKHVAFFEFAPKHFAWRLALSNVESGAVSYPLKEYAGTPESGSLNWSRDSRYLWVRAFETTRSRLLRVDLKVGSFERMATSLNNFWSYSINKDGTAFAFAVDTPHSPTNVFTMGAEGRPIQITDLNPQLSAFRLGKSREVMWKNTVDGQTVYGVVITPPEPQGDKPLPTVVQLHGGPQEMWWDSWHGTQLAWGQLLASNGYVVFLPNPRGSIGQGWKFNEAVHRDWGGMDLQDVFDGIDVLVKEGLIDENRIGIGGWSYGGFLTASATTKSSRFKAAIVGAAITDLYTYALTVDEVAWVRRFLGGNEVTDRTRYVDLSPLTDISKCKTPTLVLHGENDLRCPHSQGRAWYRGLKSLGVETEMVTYPREGHIFGERGHEVDLLARVLAWYRQHL